MRTLLACSLVVIGVVGSACLPPPAAYDGGYVAQPPLEPTEQQPMPAAAMPPNAARQISINGIAASARDLQTLDAVEQRWGGRLPDGNYWYDNATGAAGRWGGPMLGLMPPGLGLGGPLPASASGGGNGTLTGVFINGRELHPYDVARLQALVGQVYQGRWFVDANGNFGQQGGVVLGNLYALAQQRSRGGGGGGGDNHFYSRDQNGSAFVGGGCVSVSTKSGSYYGKGC